MFLSNTNWFRDVIKKATFLPHSISGFENELKISNRKKVTVIINVCLCVVVGLLNVTIATMK